MKKVSVIIVTMDRKKDLEDCLLSYTQQNYKQIEIVVVNNGSGKGLSVWLKRNYPKVILIENKKNLGAAEGRNIGAGKANGDIFLFSDDDVIADRNMIKKMVNFFDRNKHVGVAQPLIFEKGNPEIMQGAGHNINLTTGRIAAWGAGEKNTGQYNRIRNIPLCGCIWMVKRSIFEDVGGYDDVFFIPYEDSDFSLRVSRFGYINYCVGSATAFHRGRKTTFIHPWIEFLGITSPERAYRVARNKIIFITKHSSKKQKIIFFGIFLPIYISLQSLVILTTGRFDILVRYWHGIISGIGYFIDSAYKKIIYWLISWQEPVVYLLKPSVKTLLDVGCGEGLPMQNIKSRRKLDYTVGVDLFDPYLQYCKQNQIHDRYFKVDVRKLPFRNKSFDAVISLQVLEHLTKKEAWKVLKKMEKIAKKQVIVATPIGEMYHPAVDKNKLQLHHSSFQPEDFEKRGFKVMMFGRKDLLGEHGIVHKLQNNFLKKILFVFNFMLTPIYFLIPSFNDYHVYAYKNVRKYK